MNFLIYGFVEADDEEEAKFKATVEGGNDILLLRGTNGLDEVSVLCELALEHLEELTKEERENLIGHYFGDD